MNIHEKKCSKCKESKSLDNFPYKKSYCRSCGNLMSRIYKQKNKVNTKDFFSHEIKIKHFQINNKDEYNDIKINFLKYVVAEC